jgi:hypothetical protein
LQNFHQTVTDPDITLRTNVTADKTAFSTDGTVTDDNHPSKHFNTLLFDEPYIIPVDEIGLSVASRRTLKMKSRGLFVSELQKQKKKKKKENPRPACKESHRISKRKNIY